jgi:hypothetical protein
VLAVAAVVQTTLQKAVLAALVAAGHLVAHQEMEP